MTVLSYILIAKIGCTSSKIEAGCILSSVSVKFLLPYGYDHPEDDLK